MAKSTRSTTTSLYSYSAKRSLRAEEIAAYKRIGLATVLVVVLLVGGYFLAVPIIAHLGSNSSAIPSANTPLGSTDNIPPAAPKLDSLPDAVRVRSLNVTGSAESGSTVTIVLNNQDSASTLTDKQGLFSQTVSLQAGLNSISATAKDQAGNKSRPAKPIQVTYDATPPSVTIISPTLSQTTATTSSLTVQGKTEPGAQVTVNDRQAIVQSDGSFTVTLTLNPGDNPITIIATDHAGNITKISRSVTYQASTPTQATGSADTSPVVQ